MAQISDFVSQIASEAGLSNSAVYAVHLAVDEACTNIIEHAYENNPGEIECTCIETKEALIIQLHDHGNAFNPDEIPEPNMNAVLEERRRGGLGIYLMRRLMDQVTFEFIPASQGKLAGNRLIMVKRKEHVK